MVKCGSHQLYIEKFIVTQGIRQFRGMSIFLEHKIDTAIFFQKFYYYRAFTQHPQMLYMVFIFALISLKSQPPHIQYI